MLSNNIRGALAFVNLLESDAKQVYLACKERREIESWFDYMKNNVVRKVFYVQDNEIIEAYCFINHIALPYFHYLLKTMGKARQKEDSPPPR